VDSTEVPGRLSLRKEEGVYRDGSRRLQGEGCVCRRRHVVGDEGGLERLGLRQEKMGVSAADAMMTRFYDDWLGDKEEGEERRLSVWETKRIQRKRHQPKDRRQLCPGERKRRGW
jgi:hypothetical protein